MNYELQGPCIKVVFCFFMVSRFPVFTIYRYLRLYLVGEMPLDRADGGRMDHSLVVLLRKIFRNMDRNEEFPDEPGDRIDHVIHAQRDILGRNAALVTESFHIDPRTGCQGLP